MPLGTIKLPTVAQLREVAEDLGMTMSDSELATHRDCLTGGVAAYNSVDQMPDELPPVNYPRTPGRRPTAEENPLRRLVREDHDRGRADRQAQGQEGRAQGQYLPRRRADDERRLDAGGLRARRGRDRRDPHPRRRRHHRRQDGLRVFLLLRRQPHQRDRPGAQPAPPWATRPAARRQAAAPWSRRARCRWRSAATRAGRSACRRPSAASTA